jgi:hypothetical protein
MKRGRRPSKAPTPQHNSPRIGVPTLSERLLTDIHARTVRAYKAIEDGDSGFASDVLHDLAGELAEWRAAFERRTA